MFFGNLLHLRYPVTGERALVGIIKDKAVLGCLGMLGALPEFRRLGIRHKGQIHQADSTVRYVCSLEALVSQKLWISEKFPLSSLGAQDADAPPGLRPGVPDTRVQKVIGISMPFHCACDPQAVDIEISLNGCNVKVHLLVARMFVPNPHGYPVVDHKRGNKHDNRASQLEWCTIAENTRRAHALGLYPPRNSKKGAST